MIVVRQGGSPSSEKTWQFNRSFSIGRREECDVPLEDMFVSSNHASVEWQEGQWWLEDKGSKNGTYLDGQKINRAVLPHVCKIQLGHNGPLLNVEILSPGAELSFAGGAGGGEVTMLADHYFSDRSPETMGERTRLIHHAFQRVEKKHKKRYWFIIGIVGALLLGTAIAFFVQKRQLDRLERMHAMAEEIFYNMKKFELQMARFQSVVSRSSDPKLRQDFAEMQRQYQEQQQAYKKFAGEQLGISQEKLPRDEWLIHKVARLFGECDVNMPKDFVEKVREYIKDWQSSSRLRDDIALARDRGYIPVIARTMMQHDMPPQFLYLAMQESDFKPEAYGQKTYAGIAKGMWQFMPETARKYGLQTGLLVEERRHDRFDDRHDVLKSTTAAAKYLRDLYETEAQASGLLVMACYNWNENIILPIVRKMAEDPQQRNFWNFLKIRKIPPETYNYVFKIFSAAVIGEDPRYFHFNFDNPLASGTVDSAGG
jgi:membrane-bound lytic murein transglycosylase D